MACTLCFAKNACVSSGQEETSRIRKSFLFVSFLLFSLTSHPCHTCFCRKYTASFVAELDKFVLYLLKPGQLNIVDSLVTVGSRMFVLKCSLQIKMDHHRWMHRHQFDSYSPGFLFLSPPCWIQPRVICPNPFFRSFVLKLFCGRLLTNLHRVFMTEVVRALM